MNENTQKLEAVKPNFLHWEANPHFSRERLALSAPAKAGDMLILTETGYTPYESGAPNLRTPPVIGDSDVMQISGTAYHIGEIVVAFALEDGLKGETVSCIARNAVVLFSKLRVSITQETLEGDLSALKEHFALQNIVLRADVTQLGKSIS